jgi:prepilin-type N-terminal cleavage/methylation domain-containing protein
MKLNNKGFTLVEMVVVTAIFVVVIMITGSAFKMILTQTMKLYKSEESNIEGVVGLEMLRHDLEQAGFGLPDSFQNTITYDEAQFAPANILNDAGIGTQIPRPFVTIDGDTQTGLSDSSSESGNTYTILSNAQTNTDYLTIKATSLGLTPAAQKWSYLNYTSSGTKPPKTWSGANFNTNDLVTVLRRTFQAGGGVSNQLVSSDATHYSTTYNQLGLGAAFSPVLPGDTYYIYGILDQPATALRMPFNRVDYLVAKPSDATKFPNTCEPNSTGTLYKAVLDHNSGKLIYSPILDCVADMQVILGWDLVDASGTPVTDATLTGDGLIDTWTNADGSSVSSSSPLITPSFFGPPNNILTTAGHIKTKLKIIKVYILAQNGRMDPSYTSPATIAIGDPGEMTLTKKNSNGVYNLTPSMLHYRWKLYRLVIRPKNLISNQQ